MKHNPLIFLRSFHSNANSTPSTCYPRKDKKKVPKILLLFIPYKNIGYSGKVRGLQIPVRICPVTPATLAEGSFGT